MLRSVGLVVVALVAWGIAAPSRAEDFRCPTPGTIISYTNGSPWVFVGQDGLICLRRLFEQGDRAVMNRNLVGHLVQIAPNDRNAESLYRAMQALWPLEIGKRSVAKTLHAEPNGREYTYEHVYEVFGRERVDVIAGSFDTWVIHHWISGTGSDPFRQLTTRWYSPELATLVRARFRQIDGLPIPNLPGDWQITSSR